MITRLPVFLNLFLDLSTINSSEKMVYCYKMLILTFIQSYDKSLIYFHLRKYLMWCEYIYKKSSTRPMMLWTWGLEVEPPWFLDCLVHSVKLQHTCMSNLRSTYVQHMLNKHCKFTCIYLCNDSYVYIISWPELICSSIYLLTIIIRCSFSPTMFELNGIHVMIYKYKTKYSLYTADLIFICCDIVIHNS